MEYKVRASDNGYLYYAVNKDDKICFVSMFYEEPVHLWISKRSK